MAKPQVELTVKHKIFIEAIVSIIENKRLEPYNNAEFNTEEDAFGFAIEEKIQGNFLILPVYKIAK